MIQSRSRRGRSGPRHHTTAAAGDARKRGEASDVACTPGRTRRLEYYRPHDSVQGSAPCRPASEAVPTPGAVIEPGRWPRGAGEYSQIQIALEQHHASVEGRLSTRHMHLEPGTADVAMGGVAGRRDVAAGFARRHVGPAPPHAPSAVEGLSRAARDRACHRRHVPPSPSTRRHRYLRASATWALWTRSGRSGEQGPTVGRPGRHMDASAARLNPALCARRRLPIGCRGSVALSAQSLRKRRRHRDRWSTRAVADALARTYDGSYADRYPAARADSIGVCTDVVSARIGHGSISGQGA